MLKKSFSGDENEGEWALACGDCEAAGRVSERSLEVGSEGDGRPLDGGSGVELFEMCFVSVPTGEAGGLEVERTPE